MPTTANIEATTSHNGRYLGRTIAGFALIAALLVAYFHKGAPEPTLAERYPGPWQTTTHVELWRTMAKNHITHCGELQYRKAAASANEYLVYCSRTGGSWVAYLVFIGADNVIGPTATDPTLPP